MKKMSPRKAAIIRPLQATIAHHNFINALLATILIVLGIAYMANTDLQNGMNNSATQKTTLACIFDSCNLV